MENVTLEEFLKIFTHYADIAERKREEEIAKHKLDYPDSLPKYMEDDFCLATALQVMCREIIDLKRKNE